MHHWGDDFEYFVDVGRAANEIGKFCRRYGRIQVTQTKEKYGTARVYCHFGINSMCSLTHPGYHYSRYPARLRWVDYKIISSLLRWSHVNSVIIPFQERVYRMAYRVAVEKYPHIREEILCVADFPELLVGL